MVASFGHFDTIINSLNCSHSNLQRKKIKFDTIGSVQSSDTKAQALQWLSAFHFLVLFIFSLLQGSPKPLVVSLVSDQSDS